MHSFESELYFHVPVWAGFESELYFHVPVWADLIRELAHACAWENITLLPSDSALDMYAWF